MAKKKAAVKKGTKKAAEIKPPERTLATRSGCLEQDSPAYVVFSKYTLVKRDNGDVIVAFRATTKKHLDISNFAFEVIFNSYYPYALHCTPTNSSQSFEIECIFPKHVKDDHDGFGVRGPVHDLDDLEEDLVGLEDELIVTVIARKRLKGN
jgi:hypothetical protein